METEVNNASTNDLNQYQAADSSCETEVLEPSSSKLESIRD